MAVCASPKASLNLVAFSALPKRIAKISSTRSPSEKSNADQTQERSEPTLGSRTMRGSTTWFMMIFIVFSCRMSARIMLDSRCLSNLTSPTPRSIHSFLPLPLFSSVSVKRKSLDRILNVTSSSSSCVFTSTSSSCTTGVNSAVDSPSGPPSSSPLSSAFSAVSPNFTGAPPPKRLGAPSVLPKLLKSKPPDAAVDPKVSGAGASPSASLPKLAIS
mmetsp:Transcript_31739/g.105022  ORF Transcript_31739/g.105022 Transcript_31739/m.105022 type:complete len:216 (+) Transcript_31739:165-812(+)